MRMTGAGKREPLRAATAIAARRMQEGERALLDLLDEAAESGSATEVRAVLRVASAAATAQQLEDVLELVAEEARAALSADSFSISRWERDRGVLRTLINVGRLGPGEERLPADETYALADHPRVGDLLLRGEPYRTVLGDPAADGKAVEVLEGLGKEAELGVPVIYESGMWGELWATASGGRSFSDRDVRVLQAIAAQVASAIGRAELFQRVSRFAYEDPLTGLANRRRLDERLDELLVEAEQQGHELTLILCDVDGLKQLNDRDGHAAGDELLRAVGRLLSATAATYPGSLAARLGGDEFCVLLPGEPLAVARRFARQASRAATRELAAGPTTLSWGAAARAGRALDSSALLREADAAQYAAKRLGGGHLKLSTDRDAAVQQSRPPERRAVRDGDQRDELLGGVLDALDRTAPITALAALELVAGELCRALDGAAWSISLMSSDRRTLRTIRGFESQLDGPSGLRIIDAVDDPPYLLAEYPETARVLDEEGVFIVDVDAPEHADPAELAVLHELGYRTVLATGVRAVDGTYLLELYGDRKSHDLARAAPAVRLLAAYCAHIAPAEAQRRAG